jgi:transposase-like protein
MGLLDRETRRVQATVLGDRRKNAIHGEVRKHVEPGSMLYTDALRSYESLPEYGREFIDHTVEYVRGKVHTNGLENFWSLFKRTLKGTYVSVEPYHLQAYTDEQAFRFNHRKTTDADRFEMTVSASSASGSRTRN